MATKKDKKSKPKKEKAAKKEEVSLDLSPEHAAQVKAVAIDGKDKIKKIKNILGEGENAKKFLDKKFIGVELKTEKGEFWQISEPELTKKVIDLATTWHQDKVKLCGEEAQKLVKEIQV